MKRCLITGAAGFVGRHCLPLLAARGYEIHAVTRSAPTRQDSTLCGVTWHVHDLLADDATALLNSIRPTHLIHLAWDTRPGAFWSSPQNLDWMESSLRLFRAFTRIGGRRILSAGSCAEYDFSHGICHEQTTPGKPTTLYGRAKLATLKCLQAVERQAGIETTWARLFFLYGPHAPAKKFPGLVIESLLQGEPALCTHGRQQRDFLHVADVADALTALLDSTVVGPINVASGEAVTLSCIAERIAAHCGRPDLLRLGAVPAPPDEPPRIVADVGRLQHELHWTPHVSLDQGLSMTIDWWKGRARRHEAA